jgi:hypothetical protein
MHDVVEHFAGAEDALGDERPVRPFQPIKRDMPKGGVSVHKHEPKRESLHEESEGDPSGGGGA